ncbi:DDB1- and CUL4-associated factor 12-like [Littorina saxatilis]|uniref:DDB1- and CUL4-associated factor 12 beta-propeller domain-containing protein n=1 Tax=Littorina saxatilis TaxID=31220 RepID=A0AAN9C2C8_9CAEN
MAEQDPGDDRRRLREIRRLYFEVERYNRILAARPPTGDYPLSVRVEMLQQEVARFRQQQLPDIDDSASDREPDQLVDDKVQATSATPLSGLTGFQYLQRRQYGPVRADLSAMYADVVAQQIPSTLKEKEFELGAMNKIFAAKWLNDKQVVFGTKCNQLVVIDVLSGQMTTIPMLQSSEESVPAQQPCGIHGIAINPSGTMLATGASNTNDIGIYKLPTFDPFCVGEGAHSDWVFDLEWIDDEFLITGSRDNNMALWRIDNVDESQTSRMSCLYVPEYAVKKPLVVKKCEKAQKVRALSVNRSKKEMAVLSLNAFLHLWDIETFEQIWSSRLTCGKENVCMTVSEDKNLYAVGSHSCVTLVDCRKKLCQPVPTKPRERGTFQGIRSLSFKRDIITIGTGMGLVMFYDVRAAKFLENQTGYPCQLAVGSGWLRQDDNFRDIFMGAAYPNAIYTHAYDDSGVRLFAAGGPLPAGLWGNYGALWA